MTSKNAGSQRGSVRRIMRGLKINEISAVDRPAQEGALAMIMKRNDVEEVVEKSVSLTTPNMGHTHLVYLDHGDGDRVAGETSYTNGHSHPWIRTMGDTIVIGESMEHSHELAEISKAGKAEEGTLPDGSYPLKTKADLKNAIQAFGRAKNKNVVARHIKARAKALGFEDLLPTEGVLADLLAKNDDATAGETGSTVGTKEDTMTDKTPAVEATEAAKQIETLTKSLDRATRILSLKSATREFFDNLETDEAKDAFLAKSAEEQTSTIEAAKSADPVVFKSSTGTEYRKSDDQRLVEMAKQNDTLAKQAKEAVEKAADADLRKRAGELGHIPGDEDTRVALLKSIDSIADEAQRTKALEALKAQNTAMKSAFETVGHKASTEKADTATGELDALAKAYAEQHKVTIEKAYAEVVKTEEGRKLYAKSAQ